MPSFEALLDHLGQRDTPRATSRIIASERLDGYKRFSLGSLSDERDVEGDGPSGTHARHVAPDYAAGHKLGLAEGFRRGFDAGVAHAHAERAEQERQAGVELASRVASLVEEMQQRLAAVEREAANEVVALALEVAGHALRATLAVKPETIVPVVQEALASLIDESVRMHLYLNPDDEALVREELGARLARANCEIVADRSIHVGGCRIDTPRAEIDATIQTRWQRTLAALGYDRGDIA